MAQGRMQNISALFSNMRTRTILFATGGIILLAVVVGFIGFGTASNDQQAQTATVRTTSRIESIPGLTPASPEYASVQKNLNEQNYKEAIKRHGSAIPTVIGRNKDKAAESNMQFPGDLSGQAGQSGQGEQAGQGQGVGGTQDQAGSAQQTANQKVDPNDPLSGLSRRDLERLLKKQQDQMDALKKQNTQVSQADQQAMQQQIAQTQAAMQQQAQSLMASWTGNGAIATQQYVPGQLAKQKSASGENEFNGSGASGQAGNNEATGGVVPAQAPVIKTGDIMFAVLNTSVNSDEPGPVMATIVQGPLKGAKLVGSIQQTKDLPGSNGPTRVVLNFNTMSVPSQPSSLSISAVAIDPDTARTALASDVDHHYLERYGSLFASSFLEGYGSAVQQSGSTVTDSIFGGSSTAYGSLSGIEEVAAGLGQVGQEWGEQLGDVLDRPNTITVNSGVGLGILFLNDVSLNQQGTTQGSVQQQPQSAANVASSIPTAQAVAIQQPNIATLPSATR